MSLAPPEPSRRIVTNNVVHDCSIAEGRLSYTVCQAVTLDGDLIVRRF